MSLLEEIYYKDIVIYHYDKVESTSDLIREFDNRGDKIVVWADIQTRGRGRKKRDWVSPLGGLWFTLYFIPKDFYREFLPYIVKIPALAVSLTLTHYGISSHIKPPNDIYVGKKKIAGILVDTMIKSEKVEKIYIGIGLNVNNSVRVFDQTVGDIATTMHEISDKTYPVREILFKILDGIFSKFDLLFKNKKEIDKLWHKMVIHQ